MLNDILIIQLKMQLGIKSIEKKILEKSEILTCTSGDEEREQAKADIHKFQQELAKIYVFHS